jgi:hypothetical protein
MNLIVDKAHSLRKPASQAGKTRLRLSVLRTPRGAIEDAALSPACAAF